MPPCLICFDFSADEGRLGIVGQDMFVLAGSSRECLCHVIVIFRIFGQNYDDVGIFLPNYNQQIQVVEYPGKGGRDSSGSGLTQGRLCFNPRDTG